MKFTVISKSKKAYEIEFKGKKEAVVNGIPFTIETIKEDADPKCALINRRPYLVEIRQEDGRYLVTLNGKEFQYSVETPYLAKRREATVGSQGADIVRAPIPGKIIAIQVEVGQNVDEGDVLLILEAMKMENEIQSPRAGVVKEILVSEEEGVTTNQDLVVVE
ncbi:MAG: acetyl-CoA carboxylase biotin carboxyl carrier protein subunit [bacterium]